MVSSRQPMPNMPGRPPVFGTLFGLGAAALLASAFLALVDLVAAKSVFAGCMLCVLPGLWAGFAAFRPARAAEPGRIAGHMFRAAFGKWLLTAALMLFVIAAMRSGSLSPGIFFAAYGVTLAMYLAFSMRWNPLSG